MLELLHFAPAFVALTAYIFGSKSSVKASLIALSASIFGIALGNVFHTSHAAMIFDPCYINAAIAAVSAFGVAKAVFAKKTA